MSTFARLMAFLRPHRAQVALAVLLGVATVGANVGLLAVSAYLISAAALRPLLLALSFPIYLVQFFGVSRAFFRYGERLRSHRMALTLLAEVRSWFYARLTPLAPARLLGYRSGDLLSRLAADVQELENLYLRGAAPLIIALIVALSICAILAGFSASLALAAALFLALAGVGVPLLARALAARAGTEQPATRAALTMQLVDGIQGMPDLLACGRTHEHHARIDALERALGDLQRRLARIDGLRGALGILMANLALVAILALAVPLVATGRIHGVYLAFLALLLLGSFEAVLPLGQAIQYLGRSLTAGERLLAVADAAPQVADPPAPLARPAGVPTLTFDGVSFAYPLYADAYGDEQGPRAATSGHSPPALEGVSFTLSPGRRIAIVGPSGAGKSTLARLALRVWDPTGGEIRVSGAPLPRYALDDARSLYAVVAQDTYIFADTLRRNLLLARPQASESDLALAVAQAQLGELVARLPRGLDAVVGEQGVRLSGGERQRVAIARALLKDAPILILDEATAHLDPLTERALLECILRSRGERSVLLISHRLVAMERMDEILVLDHGRVVERGTHAALLAAGGQYHQLFETQNQALYVS
jgi:ATP-binding cassette subfamily C protein CydC